ncbi:MAG: cobyric acid synthase CobQ, partial [Nitrospirota bacterium]|nr:cobyric acid synthase CobQ [Nitrospirota bacterium]
LDESIKQAFSKGIQIMGMCGGYQMLGKKIYDPHGIESPHKEVDGIGLLNIETTFNRDKITSRVEAEILGVRDWGLGISKKTNPQPLTPNPLLKGYEIHMGTSSGDIGLFKLRRLSSNSSLILDGSINGNCWGTYIHGIFENDSFRRGIINSIREQGELPPVDSPIKYSEMKEKAIDNLADIVKQNLDMNFINRIVGL